MQQRIRREINTDARKVLTEIRSRAAHEKPRGDREGYCGCTTSSIFDEASSLAELAMQRTCGTGTSMTCSTVRLVTRSSRCTRQYHGSHQE
eukprot:2645456-Amphidinium_carterae.1